MKNPFENFFNPPKKFKVGQIWHCNSISEDMVITNVDFLKEKIVRCSILTRATHLNDDKDIVVTPDTTYLRKLFGLPRMILRLTDGPLLITDLSYYKGMLQKKNIKKIPGSLKKRPKLNPLQEEMASVFLKKLEPLRCNVMATM